MATGSDLTRLAENMRRMSGPVAFAEQFKSLNVATKLSEDMRRISAPVAFAEQFKSLNFATRVAAGMKRAAVPMGLQDALRDVVEATETLEGEIAPSETENRVEWLARLPVWAQAYLFLAVMMALDEFTRFVEDMQGVDVPDELQSLTRTLLAVGFVIATVLHFRAEPPDEDSG